MLHSILPSCTRVSSRSRTKKARVPCRAAGGPRLLCSPSQPSPVTCPPDTPRQGRHGPRRRPDQAASRALDATVPVPVPDPRPRPHTPRPAMPTELPRLQIGATAQIDPGPHSHCRLARLRPGYPRHPALPWTSFGTSLSSEQVTPRSGALTDKMIDMISAIQELSGLTTRELSEMLKESDSFVLQSKAEDGGSEQVDMEKLVSSLPLHLLVVSLDIGRGSDLTYVLRGVRFLHCLSELATRHTRLEQVLVDDVKLSEQVMGLIFFVLSILSHWKKEDHLGASPFIHSSLVAASLRLMTSYFSSHWHELVHILLAHPKVDIFMDVAFDSLHEDMRLLSVRLSTLGTKALIAPASRAQSNSSSKDRGQGVHPGGAWRKPLPLDASAACSPSAT